MRLSTKLFGVLGRAEQVQLPVIPQREIQRTLGNASLVPDRNDIQTTRDRGVKMRGRLEFLERFR